MKLSFIICTEPAIENKSRLLVRSIRTWVDETIPIYSFSPRNKELSQQTHKEFTKYGVTHQTYLLNTKYDGIGNKPLVMAYAEQNVESDILVFLDSDKVLFDWPDYIIDQSYEVAARPENLLGIGVKNLKNSTEAKYWSKLYEAAGKIATRMVLTTADEVYVLEYYNSGMIAARTNIGIFSFWERLYKDMHEKQIFPQSGPYFSEQSTFSAAVTAIAKKVLILPRTYNYPLACHNSMIPQRRIKKFEEAISIHYHKMFEKNNWKCSLNNLIIEKTEKFAWLEQNLQNLYS